MAQAGVSRQIISHHINQKHLVLPRDDLVALRIEHASDLYYRLCLAAEESWIKKSRPPTENELSLAVGVVPEDPEFRKAIRLFAAKTDWREGEMVMEWKKAVGLPAWDRYSENLLSMIRRAYIP